jgi:hypothetical protein
MSEEELKVIQKYYFQLSKITMTEESLRNSHSIDEAENMTGIKKEREEDILDSLKRNASGKE